MIRLRVLGSLDLRDGDGQLLERVLAQPKRLALLVYLVVATPEGAQRRDRLLALFWPELDAARSRDALNQALRFLRHELGAEVLVRRGADQIGVADDRLWCDAVAFRSQLGRGDAAAAFGQYRGTFLDAFHVERCHELESWMEAERESFRRAAAGAAWRVAADAERQGDLSAAVASAQRAMALAPDDEPALRHLLRLHRRAGDRAGALRAYREFAHRLSAEYGCEPSGETAALVRDLLEDRGGGSAHAATPNEVREATAAAPRGLDRRPVDGEVRPGAGVPRRPWRAAAYTLVAVTAVALGAAVTMPGAPPPRTTYRAGLTVPIAVTPAVEYQPAISPDGKFVAFAAATPDGFRIFVRQIDGGRAILLTGDLPGTHIAPGWSPDQTRLVFEATVGESPAAAYVVPALGGTPHRIVTSPSGGVSTPAWSPSGSEIAYADDRGIWVQRVDGRDRRLVVGGRSPHSPAWSPDGLWLAFVEGVPQTLDNVSTTTIEIVRVDGGAAVPVTDGKSAASSPVWAPDGRSVLFVNHATGVADVYQQPIRHDGTPAGPPDRLTVGLAPMTISMSTDGRRLAYDALRRQSSIWMARVGGNTGASVQITSEKETIECLSLSHDGKWLAYDSNRGGSFDVYKVRVDGGEPVRLTSSPANEFCPAWSADDSEIAYHSARLGVRDIFTVKADGGTDTTAVSDSFEKFEPWWSPDGRRLTYFVLRGSAVAPTRGGIMVVERDERGVWSRSRPLISDLEPNIAAAPWSPRTDEVLLGGTALLAISARDGSRRVLVDSAALDGNANWPKWSPDGSTVYFHYTRPTGPGFVSSLESRPGNSPTGFMALAAAGGAPRMMVREAPGRPVFRGQFATDGRRFFFTSPNVESDVHVLELNARRGRRE